MPISIMTLKLEITNEIDRNRWRHNFKDNKIPNCQYLADEIKHEAGIWYAEVIDDDDFNYGIGTQIN